MDNNTLKIKAVSGFFWRLSEDALNKIINFVISIVLARMLLPEDYGIIALVSVFITICDKLVVSGFTTSLIQKKEADNTDFSTVFYFSLGISLLLYILLFFIAPIIADFYDSFNKGLLISVIRVMGVQIIITAVSSVQSAYVSRTMQFKRFFWSNSVGMLISAVVGLYMAYTGCGVWALVAQNLIKAFIGMLVLWFTVKWRPMWTFSSESFRTLYSYGWKIFAASMIKALYNDLRSLAIGKFFSADVLAFYNKGQSFPQLVEGSVSGTIDSVFFPTISRKQSSKEEMMFMLKRTIKVSTYLLTPLLFGMAAVATPLITVLLTEKWLPSVFYLRVISIAFVLMPVEIENLQAIKAIGRSDLVLKLEIFKRVIGVILLVIAVPMGVKAIAMSFLWSNFIAAILNVIYSAKLFGYSCWSQVKDIIPYWLMSGVMVLGVWGISFVPFGNVYVQLVVMVLTGTAIYVLLSLIFRVESFSYILNTIKSFFKERTKRQ